MSWTMKSNNATWRRVGRPGANRRLDAGRSPDRPAHRTGSALIFVLVAVAALTLATFTFSRLMFTEHKAARVHGRALQAMALAESGLEYTKAFLAQDEDVQLEQGGLYDNPDRFRGVLVLDDETPEDRGRFTVVAPRSEGEQFGGVRYGLEDESTRLNLNILLLADMREENGGRKLLMGLPGMTEDVADAILDWLDADDEPRQYGAERETYSGLDPPYAPKNGPLETVEELLLVRGVTPELLFGPDANRNSMLDPHEPSGESVGGVENPDGRMNRGWSGLLTLHSLERNVRPDGRPKIYVNQEDLEELHAELVGAVGEEAATFIVLYRQFGPYTGDESGERLSAKKPDFKQPGRFKLKTILDLVGRKVEATFAGDDRPTVIEEVFPALGVGLFLTKLMENLTTNPSPAIPGRININQAPRTIIEGIPGMSDEIVEAVMSRRVADVSADHPFRHHETWLLIEGLVTLEELTELMPYINAGGDVYRAQFVGYYDNLGPAARIEVILDATQATPRVVSWKDISHLGRGYALETLGIEYEPAE